MLVYFLFQCTLFVKTIDVDKEKAKSKAKRKMFLLILFMHWERNRKTGPHPYAKFSFRSYVKPTLAISFT
jgi:hypothetical protein